MKKSICILGLGYIGLPTAAMFASSGHKVWGVDVNQKVVSTLNNQQIHIEEPGLEEVVVSNIRNGNIEVSTQPQEADVFIIAVPTPVTEDLKADLTYVESASKAIVPYLRKGNLVIIESTISPGCTTDLVAPILAESGLEIGNDLYLSHCPERVLPGKILQELVENNRIAGGINEASAIESAELYQSFVKGDIYLTDATSAEMAKLMENTFRDVNIALANELALISEEIGVNALEVIKLANKHPRVNIHSPGPGVGGHCLAIDPYFIVEKAPAKARMIALSREINRSMPEFVVKKVEEHLGTISNPKVAVLGITYKGNIDDCRESPANDVIKLLKEKGFDVAIHDPHVLDAPYDLVSLEDAVKASHCVLILADHDEFKNLDIQHIKDLMNVPFVFDTKNCISAEHSNEVQLLKLGNFA